MKSARGFTLVEVLVALAIVAIALIAGLQAVQGGVVIAAPGTQLPDPLLNGILTTGK